MKKNFMIDLPVHFLEDLIILELIKETKERLKLLCIKISGLDNFLRLTSPIKILLIHLTNTLFNRIILNDTKGLSLQNTLINIIS
jgi:hypothetical protein